MRTLVSALVAGLMLPALAVADGAPPPLWSIGGGLTWGIVLGGSAVLTPSGAYPSSFDASIPSASASVERRLGERTWLAFGLAGGTSRAELDPPAPNTFYASTTEQDVTRAFVSVGLRHVLTPAGAPVDFSILGAVEAGFARGDATVVEGGGEETDTTLRSRVVGLTGGIAVDRTLAGTLSLRIATPLVTASYAGVTETSSRAPDRDGSTAGVDVVLAPRLELRIAF